MTDKNKEVMDHLEFPRIFKLDKAIILGDEDFTTGVFGDIRYRPPEVIRGRAYNSKADSYSFGIIMYFLLTGKLPFEGSKAKISSALSGDSHNMML